MPPQDFIPNLKDHLLARLRGDPWNGEEHNYTDADRAQIFVERDRIYRHKVLCNVGQLHQIRHTARLRQHKPSYSRRRHVPHARGRGHSGAFEVRVLVRAHLRHFPCQPTLPTSDPGQLPGDRARWMSYTCNVLLAISRGPAQDGNIIAISVGVSLIFQIRRIHLPGFCSHHPWCTSYPSI